MRMRLKENKAVEKLQEGSFECNRNKHGIPKVSSKGLLTHAMYIETLLYAWMCLEKDAYFEDCRSPKIP